MTTTHPLLRQATESLKRTNALRGELAVKAAVLHQAATALRTGADPTVVASSLSKHIHALHHLAEK